MIDRECGDCRMCCKVVGIFPLNKAPQKWCDFATANPKDGCGCSLVEEGVNHKLRPEWCNQFKCLWLLNPEMPEELAPHRVKAVISVAKVSPHVHPFEQMIEVRIEDIGDHSNMVKNTVLRRWLKAKCQEGLMITIFTSDDKVKIYYPDVAVQVIDLPTWEDQRKRFDETGQVYSMDLREFGEWAGAGCGKFRWIKDPEGSGALVQEELTYFDHFAALADIVDKEEETDA